MNNVFRLVNPVYEMDTYIFKVDIFIKQANNEENPFLVPRIQHVGFSDF